MTKIIEISSKLSKPIDVVRVDLYDMEGVVYFGEFSFTPEAGCASFSDSGFGAFFVRRILGK